ncbi:MAG: TraR/DksA C4-type zinc finger protein [Fulvivirga sp.]|nr:TraR/DksA C4-type zinc finger protein [Fulvivirga sp.]
MTLDKARLKEKIEEEIASTREDISALKDQSSPVSPENAIGRISRMDAINNKSISEASLRQAEEKLSKLETALAKVDQDNFGICIRCGQPIPAGRLMLLPHSTTCVKCA